MVRSALPAMLLLTPPACRVLLAGAGLAGRERDMSLLGSSCPPAPAELHDERGLCPVHALQR